MLIISTCFYSLDIYNKKKELKREMLVLGLGDSPSFYNLVPTYFSSSEEKNQSHHSL